MTEDTAQTARTSPAAGPRRRGWRPAECVAAVLSVFAVLTVNGWIYSVHGLFLALHPDGWHIPPTISRAASPPEIAVPFSFWVTASGIALAVAAAILCLYYFRLPRHVPQASRALRLAMWVGALLIVVLQVVAGVGMNWLSVYTLLNNGPMHMVGSVTFFASQALVIMVYAAMNAALLRDHRSLAALAEQGWLNPRMVRWRLRMSLLAVALAVAYAMLFTLKDIYTYPEVKWVQHAYVTLEPIVISGYLVVVLLACADKLRRPV